MTEDFWQVICEMDGVATGEDADPEFSEEQMALVADWRRRLLAAAPSAHSVGGAAAPNEPWVGSSIP